jgi:biopolymer transport protein ExbD
VNRQTVRLDQVAAAVRGRVGLDGNIVVAADSAAANGLVVQAILQARAGGAEHVLIAVQRDE